MRSLALLANLSPAALDAHEFMLEAECVTATPEVFFPTVARGKNIDYSEAYRICGRCPVARECAEFALENELEHGCFGGLNPSERIELRRRGRAPGACIRCGRPATATRGRRVRGERPLLCHNCEEQHG